MRALTKKIAGLCVSVALVSGAAFLPYAENSFRTGNSGKGTEIESIAGFSDVYQSLSGGLALASKEVEPINATVELTLFGYNSLGYSGMTAAFEFRLTGYFTEESTLLSFSVNNSQSERRDSYMKGQLLRTDGRVLFRAEEWSDYRLGRATVYPEALLYRWIETNGDAFEGFFDALECSDAEAQKSISAVRESLKEDFVSTKKNRFTLGEKGYEKFCGAICASEGYDAEAAEKFGNSAKGEFTVDLSEKGSAELKFSLDMENKKEPPVGRVFKQGTLKLSAVGSTFLKLPKSLHPVGADVFSSFLEAAK